jgi:hypothetical protein
MRIAAETIKTSAGEHAPIFRTALRLLIAKDKGNGQVSERKNSRRISRLSGDLSPLARDAPQRWCRLVLSRKGRSLRKLRSSSGHTIIGGRRRNPMIG